VSSDLNSPTPARRRFLKWVTGVSSAVVAALTGIPALRASISPGFRGPEPTRWVRLGEVDLLDIGVPVRVDFSETVADAWLVNRVQRGV